LPNDEAQQHAGEHTDEEQYARCVEAHVVRSTFCCARCKSAKLRAEPTEGYADFALRSR
jgi:hypothetical protein